MSDIMSLEDQARIELTLRTRETIIKSLTKDGGIPKDPNDRGLLLAALDGMDRTVLSKAKIKSDDTAAKSEAETARTIADLLMRVDSKRKTRNVAIDVESTILPEITLVPDEVYVGVMPIKCDEIVNQNSL